MPSPTSMVHTFSRNPLDRGEAARRTDGWLAAAMEDSNARWLPFWRQRVLLDNTSDQPALRWCNAQQLSGQEQNDTPIFLGLLQGVPHFTCALSGEEAPQVPNVSGKFTDCRAAAMTVSAEEAGIVGQARAQLEWHRRNRYCGSCGAATEQQRGGHLRVCNACGARKFPRTDPVVIMLSSRGDECLLGQPNGPIAGSGFYTALAGFVDQGESIEEAVRRETREEAGINVGEVRYHSSQPWPFPHTLMIGCHGHAVSSTIAMDAEEMADVRWFHRDEVRDVLHEQSNGPQQTPQQLAASAKTSGKPPPVRVPGPMAIAHHLIAAWVEREPGTQFD